MECDKIFILFLIFIIYIEIINLNNFGSGVNKTQNVVLFIVY